MAIAAAALEAHALHQAGRAHGRIGPSTVEINGSAAELSPPPQDMPPGLVTTAEDRRQMGAVAPELLYGDPPGPATDIWSLGATLHTLLSGASLFPGIEYDHPVIAVQRIMFTRPMLDPSLFGPVVPIVARCTQRDPADRWPTAADLSSALMEAADQP